MIRIVRKYLVLMATGGLLYVVLELIWRGHHNRSGVPDRLHSQPVVGLEYLGLQRAVW